MLCIMKPDKKNEDRVEEHVRVPNYGAIRPAISVAGSERGLMTSSSEPLLAIDSGLE